MTDSLGNCSVCHEVLASSDSRLPAIPSASCNACSQRFHPDCLTWATDLDSRCPLCRADLAEVGFVVNSVVARPPRRRLTGQFPEGFDQNLRDLIRITASITARFRECQEIDARNSSSALRIRIWMERRCIPQSKIDEVCDIMRNIILANDMLRATLESLRSPLKSHSDVCRYLETRAGGSVPPQALGQIFQLKIRVLFYQHAAEHHVKICRRQATSLRRHHRALLSARVQRASRDMPTRRGRPAPASARHLGPRQPHAKKNASLHHSFMLHASLSHAQHAPSHALHPLQ